MEQSDSGNAYITFVFDLAQQIEIENRQVNSIESIFGSISGISGLLKLFFSFLVGSFQKNQFLRDQVESMFLQE